MAILCNAVLLTFRHELFFFCLFHESVLISFLSTVQIPFLLLVLFLFASSVFFFVLVPASRWATSNFEGKEEEDMTVSQSERENKIKGQGNGRGGNEVEGE